MQVDLHEEGRDANRDSSKKTSQKLVWQFRLSKAGRALPAFEICKRAAADVRNADISNAAIGNAMQKKPRAAEPGEARPQVRGERSWRGPRRSIWQSSETPDGNQRAVDPTHLLSRMLLREPRASLADPAGGDYATGR